ncbi:hypothetical protein GCM10023075_73090 [Streptosporangium album]
MDPGSLEAAVGLAVLGGAELRGHMVNRVDTGWWEEDWKPTAQIPPDDGVGRALVDEAVRAARHVLSLDPTNNLAAYLEGLAHECGGAREQALGGYLRALELDRWDEGALTRANALDDEYVAAPAEGPEPNPHSRHFWLLRSSELISNSGDERVVYRRLSDSADVRYAIESVLVEVKARNPDLESAWGTDEYSDCQDGGFDLSTYAPGRPPSGFDVYDALRRTPSGELMVDWAAVDLDEPPSGKRLPPGQPVRVDGRTHFDGQHEPVEE